MTTQELLELASLDAMGLLETQEAEAYEQAFQAASPQVQAQVRREQARFARPEFLPAVEPGPGLRARVVAAIREAIGAAERDAIPFHPELLPSRGVNRWWRAAAVGAMAASVAFGLSMFQMQRDYTQIAANLKRNVISDKMLKEFGPQFERSLFDQNTRFVGFKAEKNFQGRAVLLINSEKGTGQIFVKDMPTGSGEYELVVLDESGKAATALLTIRGSDVGVTRHEVPGITADIGDRLAIVSRGDSPDAAVRVLTSNGM